MKIKDSTISKGFIIGGLMNLTVLIHSRFFTNETIPQFDPVVMSNFGLLMIVIWGLAYISVAKKYNQVKWLIGVFVVEKLIYGYTWINWLLNNSLPNVYEKDVMAGVFYTLYGVNDWLFFLFFLYVFVRISKLKNNIK